MENNFSVHFSMFHYQEEKSLSINTKGNLEDTTQKL